MHPNVRTRHNITDTRWKLFSNQLVAVFAVSVATPTFFFTSYFINPGIAAQGIYNSILASTFACILGTYLVQKVTSFPGVRAFTYIIPSYASSYALSLAFLFASRLNYNRPFLFVSLVLSILLAFVLGLYIQRHSKRRIHIVPFGRIDLMENIQEIEWVELKEAKVPSDPKAVIVADLKFDHTPEWERMLAEAAIRGHVVYHTKQLRESLTGCVTIDHLSENSFGSLVPNLAYVKVKRCIDFVSSVMLLPLLLPFLAIIALVIKFDSPGPVLFKQERMGYRGRIFLMYKFRTMHVRRGVEDSDRLNDAMTVDNDARITRIGRFLRRSRLDELPQILNIFRGEMSWIGPRPEALALSEWYDSRIPFYAYRHIVRPGITGWAQVSQGHVTQIVEINTKLNFDFYYVKNFSFWIDVVICMRTIQTMITGFGAK